MKALVLHGVDDLRLEEVETPSPGPGEALIKVKAAGICGSDVPRVNAGAAHFYPIILGHEFSGIIEGLGEDCQEYGLKVGQHATAAPLIPCMRCADCQKGDYSLCRHYSFIGSRVNGAFAEYVTVPARNVVPLDPSIPFVDGALFEPSTVALHGVWGCGFRGGEDVAVLGFGTIGYFTAQWARLLGAKRLAVFDISEERLELARQIGADKAFNSSVNGTPEEALEFTKGSGYGYVFETAGQNNAMSLAFELAGNKATVCFVGTASKDLNFGWKLFEKLNRKEFWLSGSWMSYSPPFPGREWTMTNEYLANGRLVLDKSLLFKTFPLEDGAKAFRLFKQRGAVKGKIMLLND
ncbi:MAG: galactitol-1-phosphate 5-dehydrogenase [Deltaproteobacteria bacterium]|jgi:L-iditol 2-dehydrogenase|nr:galactitol-1-phosphate 5-dehydrogenase [Deltaproteobacteria bacterium]